MRYVGILFVVMSLAGFSAGTAVSQTHCCVVAGGNCGTASCVTVAGPGDCPGSKPDDCGEGYCQAGGFGCVLITAGVPTLTSTGVGALLVGLLLAGAGVLAKQRRVRSQVHG